MYIRGFKMKHTEADLERGANHSKKSRTTLKKVI